ncbi:iron complex transport system permease protein [Haloactinospora alba]|uniref:Iron complex transport system permease protein n=1 Tax=Haloactinospora alba TaxID=405555 RepID=A0A543N9V8_9ACTN|nr:iron chelate uptake ABC transporter family permease subunit [Haloactinospora alba]TQN28617.1 iron complex transport system permease protein [Haloactinospora alba]
MPGTVRVRHRLGTTAVTVSGVALIALSIAVTITIGPAGISVSEVASVIVARLGGSESGMSVIREGIVWDLRLPRTLLAALCGAGLGMCGAVMQSLLRNPLADPFVLGVSSGASTGAVLVVIVGVGGTLSLSVGAFAGACLAFALVMLLSKVSGGTTAKVILSGVAVMQLFSSLTSFIVFSSGTAEETRGVLFWLLGSLSGASWLDVAVCAGALTVAYLVFAARATALDAFAFGDDAAASLGVFVARARTLLLVAAALLTAVLVSACGAIGFVGLVLPHAARALVGPGHRFLLPTTALAGAVFMMWVDTVARALFEPQELPVGVMTSLIGVPVFVLILHRARRPW